MKSSPWLIVSLFLAVLAKNTGNLYGVQFAVIFAIDHHGGSQKTGTQAGSSLKGKLIIRACFTLLQIKIFLDESQNGLSSLDVAGCAAADFKNAFSLRFCGKPGIECDDALDMTGWKLQSFCNGLNGLRWYIAKTLLNRLKQRDQSPLLALVLCYNRRKFFPIDFQ